MKAERMGYVVTNDTTRGQMYWGPGALEHGKIIGTFKRPKGDEGALILLDTGCFVQGNAQCIRTTPSVVMELAAKARAL